MSEKPITERDLQEIANRATNILIPMDPGARHDLTRLLSYIKGLREKLVELDSQMTGARDTVLVVCKRQPDYTLRIPNEDVAALDPHDALWCKDEVDETTGEVIAKVFTFVPKPRIIQ